MLFISRALAAIPPPINVTGLPNVTTTSQAIAKIIDITAKILDFMLLIAVIYVIYAGIRLIVSGGDDGEKDKAKHIIIYVIVGIVVILFARVIVVFVNDLLG